MISVTGAKLQNMHGVSPFSRQAPTSFESRFNFLDLLNTHKLIQRPKTFRRANRKDDDFRGGSLLLTLQQENTHHSVSPFSQRQPSRAYPKKGPHLSPVSIF
jgi:hypothetical protein